MVILKNHSKMVLAHKTLKGFDHTLFWAGNRFRLELETVGTELICRFCHLFIWGRLLNTTLPRRTDRFQDGHTADAQYETECVTECLCFKKSEHLFLVLVLEISRKVGTI